MVAASGKPRQRAWRPKNRNGCKTCKVRKVKCDEEKPYCKRCTSTGRKCDGYDPTFRPPPPSTSPQLVPSTSSGKLWPLTNGAVTRSPSPVYLAPALQFSTATERESFDFFTSRAVSSLRGSLESSFWQREILQAAYREPAIQHCVIALGAMHRRFFEGKGSHINAEDLSDNYLQFALSQSNQAIQDLVGKQGLRAMTTRADKVTLMTCSILFFSMSCLQGYQKDAFEHLRSGIRMLNEIDGTDNDMAEDHPVDVESLRSIFVGLDLQARSIMPRSQARRWVSRPKTKATEVLPLPELSMSSILAVLRFLESLYNQIHAFFQSASSRPAEDANDIYLEYSDLITRFHRGTALLETLCEKSSPNTDEFTEPLVALRLQQSAMEYLLRNPRPDMGAKFSFISRFASENDLFNEPFDASAHVVKMFELATRLLPISSTLTPVFTMGIGPLSVLWLVAMRAPSTCALLRKRAISLMLSHPRREGFWDGMLAGRIAQEALRLEQESAQEELGLSGSPNPDLTVPDELRIAIVGITYVEDNDRKAKIQYINARDVKAGRPGSVQWINW